MAMEPKKRQGKGSDGGRSTRARVDDGVRTATENEVEEFFAILRRIRTAARFFGNNHDGKAKQRWRPAFEWEDFEGANGVKSDGERGTASAKGKQEVEEEKTEENAVAGSFDLNAEPEPEHPSHFNGCC